MRERLSGLRNRLGFAELATMGALVLAFLIGGFLGGTPVTILRTCSGIRQDECPPDEYIALNPATGLLAVALVIIVLLVLDLGMRRRQG